MESPRAKHRLKVPVFTISRNLSQATASSSQRYKCLRQIPSRKEDRVWERTDDIAHAKNRRHRQKTSVCLTLTPGFFPDGRVWIWTWACEKWSEQVRWLVCRVPAYGSTDGRKAVQRLSLFKSFGFIVCREACKLERGWNAFPWPRVFSKSCLLFRKSPEQLAALNCGTSRRVLNKN